MVMPLVDVVPRIMEQIIITRISEIQSGTINHLLEESLSQGFRFVERLIREYRSGLNCFDKSGEVLLTASVQGAVLGIGGLNQDPYFNDPKVGRLRHLYVAAFRGRQAPPKPEIKRVVPGKTPPTIPSLWTM